MFGSKLPVEPSKKAESMSEEPKGKMKAPSKYKKLNTDMEASFKRVEELRAGRTLGDIPLTDEYWKALSNHRFHHGR